MEEKTPDTVYQFKITLNGTKPCIWRRIQVPKDYNFEDLHFAIQEAMGWGNLHMHQFKMLNPVYSWQEDVIGVPDRFIYRIPESETKIAKYFVDTGYAADYEYHFGNWWEHSITLEDILPAEDGVKYPKCIAGKMACPPENCGGVGDYYYFLKALADPNHKEHKNKITWLDEVHWQKEFYPKEFNRKSLFGTDWREILTYD